MPFLIIGLLIFINSFVFNALMFITSGLFISIKYYKYYKLLSNILINLANAHEDDFWEENLYMNSSKNLVQK